MKISREVKTAILVLLGIILFILGFNYLKGQNLFESKNIYYSEFDYNALSTNSVVTVKGNTVGKIQDIAYDYNSGKTRIAFSVNDQLKFSKNSTIRLYETGLMGGNAIAIIMSNDNDLAKPGDVLKSEVEVGLIRSLSKNFSGLSTDLNATLKSTDTLIINLNKMVVDESDAGLKKTILELNNTLKAYKNLAYSINGVVSENDKNISTILENFKTTSNELSQISANLKEANLGATVQSLNTTLTNVNTLISGLNKGEGSMGKLLKDETLYHNLEGASKEIEALLKDIKLHPKRYFRILSKKEIPYSEPETN
ncbi:MAG: MCE family protein [Flavobacteriales bacterium]|nr:MCE family protein [Flavobacteriia bacterium]NCP05748.1 MCE family protein [Flavobacteriales bacterium]PIV94522.1 MAG: MCE family protein [Flavobacteriaceae bacterium CG17_big_fil_post_rev_8_21_14_2_50_33_15]PIY10665.1 MAG: MCE family protein [Flavobacteriaceae bacterium CG_4_10_14_3_um_filter_33_47]PJB18129.1 MAG: MCE family protein [Flavobacteriaceae bacterium CG_4_9_14_3_um_filter_33_16]